MDESIRYADFTIDIQNRILEGTRMAKDLNHRYLDVPHLLLTLLRGDTFEDVLSERDIVQLGEYVFDHLPPKGKKKFEKVVSKTELYDSFRRAKKIADLLDVRISGLFVVYGILTGPDRWAVLLHSYGLTPKNVIHAATKDSGVAN